MTPHKRKKLNSKHSQIVVTVKLQKKNIIINRLTTNPYSDDDSEVENKEAIRVANVLSLLLFFFGSIQLLFKYLFIFQTKIFKKLR